MELVCLGSSSSGNCYLLNARTETLVIECGVDFLEVKKALGFSLRRIAGCVVSHEHKDHAKHMKEIMRCGIRVLALAEVFDSQGLARNPFATPISPLKGYKVGGFNVYALPAAHDVPCLGFMVEHQEMGKTLFLTDTMLVEYNVKGLNHIMIEANYSDELLEKNIQAGEVPAGMRDRLLHSHMELKTTAEYLRYTDLSQVNDITLLHLSAQNSDAEMFRKEIASATGKPTYVARKGMTLNYNKMPY